MAFLKKKKKKIGQKQIGHIPAYNSNMLGTKYHTGPNIEEFLLTGDFLSIALITNFLSLKEIFLISLQGKPILGVILQDIV